MKFEDYKAFYITFKPKAIFTWFFPKSVTEEQVGEVLDTFVQENYEEVIYQDYDDNKAYTKPTHEFYVGLAQELKKLGGVELVDIMEEVPEFDFTQIEA
ncbi:MAG: hypothetical protein LBV67_10580 [Streptococcaceae bacterium]|jgi:hypothetical protein|nr:hypothetical protein [Streptococcaceae bacterium]